LGVSSTSPWLRRLYQHDEWSIPGYIFVTLMMNIYDENECSCANDPNSNMLAIVDQIFQDENGYIPQTVQIWLNRKFFYFFN
jgi:hypothetical protein